MKRKRPVRWPQKPGTLLAAIMLCTLLVACGDTKSLTLQLTPTQAPSIIVEPKIQEDARPRLEAALKEAGWNIVTTDYTTPNGPYNASYAGAYVQVVFNEARFPIGAKLSFSYDPAFGPRYAEMMNDTMLILVQAICPDLDIKAFNVQATHGIANISTSSGYDVSFDGRDLQNVLFNITTQKGK